MAQLVGLAENDLRVLFRRFDSADTARDGLRDVLPRLVALYGAAAATLAADWYDEVRDAAGAAGRFRAIPAELPDQGRTDALAGWAVAPLFGAAPDFAAALSKTQGGTQRIIANAARETVTVSSVQDRAAKGWVRTGTGGCDFCRSRIGLKITSDVVFESHDACGCVAVPNFG